MEDWVALNHRFWLLIILSIVLAGCTITQINEQNTQLQKSNAEKEERLKELQARHQELEHRKEALIEELNKELDYLKGLIKEYKDDVRKNKQLGANIDAKNKRLAELEKQIDKHQKELAYGAGGMGQKTLALKRKQVEMLSKEIKTYLGMEID